MIFNTRFNTIVSEIKIVLWKLVYFGILEIYRAFKEIYCFCYQGK